jgi:acetyl-CoA decarbonylase/synthase complex subunit gamma
MIRIPDTLPEERIRALVTEVRDESFVRVGADLRINGVAVEQTAGDPALFAAAVGIVESLADLPLVLISRSPEALERALIHCGSYLPLIHAATRDNQAEMPELAKKYGCPLAVRGESFEEIIDIVRRCTASGVNDLVIDLAPKTLSGFLLRSTRVRRDALARTVTEFGYPVFVDTAPFGRQEAGVMLGILKYASVIVCDPLSAAQKRAILTLRQNIYTDPQKPIQMSPGVYHVGSPGKDSPVLVTVNFSLTYFTLQGYLEATRIPCYLLIVDTEGLSVLTAVASGKLSETLVRDAIRKYGVEELVSHRTLIIPGYAAPLSGRIEDATGWHVLVGPRDAADIGEFLEQMGNT